MEACTWEVSSDLMHQLNSEGGWSLVLVTYQLLSRLYFCGISIGGAVRIYIEPTGNRGDVPFDTLSFVYRPYFIY